MTDVELDRDDCTVLSGTLDDPYTGDTIAFTRGRDTSDDVQIDHVVALADAWRAGADRLTDDERLVLANDEHNLVAVDGPTNNRKADRTAERWLPPAAAPTRPPRSRSRPTTSSRSPAPSTTLSPPR
ncbi:GmrSD restriction endonuclease domain-containing protein [Pseudonocardia sp. HH130630-07]|uniref:GmrSD restriction endonuclease domain-containing protein n=1 Tax=Pseudonocardia sp. HH130630-07 TaxID=1690815 RepID=UPI0009F1FF20|nr:DUF1524 domain-containing protein [Pseudonocardia sp. HH130630-07]